MIGLVEYHVVVFKPTEYSVTPCRGISEASMLAALLSRDHENNSVHLVGEYSGEEVFRTAYSDGAPIVTAFDPELCGSDF